MSDSGKAVFLSYASQDVDAAKRIAEALRASGIEVWFDQSELRGGDAWDQKLRRQIKDCALFIAIVSKNTDARLEGYFRREWKLAIERTHDMAEERAFLLPVVIDDTSDGTIHVPEKFHDVQWTRLPGGETPAAIVERVKTLLQPEAAVAAPAPASAKSPGPDTKSIAVLAFENLSSDKENEYFSEGISEELLNVLAKIPGLRVVARTSAFSFKGKNVPVPEIAQKLNVAYVVEGSVRKAGDRVRITAQLIKAADGFHAWSESYDRKLEDIFDVQGEIAQTIVRALRPTLVAGSDPAAGEAAIKTEVATATKGGTKNVEAYRLFLQGRFSVNQFSRESFGRAADYLRQALVLDPSFALAWAELARAYVNQNVAPPSDLSPGQLFKQARDAAQRALALEADLAEGHAALMTVQTLYDFDWLGAEESGRKALALAPANATIVTDSMLLALARGQAENAIAQGRRSVDLDPVNVDPRFWLFWAYLCAGRTQDAEAEARRLIELSPTAPYSYAGVGLACLLQGRLDEALTAAEREKEDWSRLTAVALVRWKQGQGTVSDAALDQLITRFSTVAAFQVVEVYAYRGETDQAFAWLERAHTQHDPGLVILKLDPFLRNLHGDPRWPAFLKKMRLDD